MKAKTVHWANFLLLAVSLLNSVHCHHIYDPEDDLRMIKVDHDTDDTGCCPLVWIPIVRGKSQFKVIPFSAIPAAMNNESSIYYARKGSHSMYPGLIDDSFNTYFEDGKNQATVNWSTIEVLSNPYECNIAWFNCSNQLNKSIKGMYLPTFKDFTFTTDWTNGTNMNHSIYDIYEVYYGMAIGDLITQPKDKSIYLLYNNCTSTGNKSLNNWINVRVTNFTYENINLTKEFFPVILESLSMVNSKDYKKSAEVGLEAVVPDMTYFYNAILPLNKLEADFNVEYTEDAERQLFKLYDLLFHRYGFAFNLDSVANITHEKVVSLTQSVEVAPKSNTTAQLLGKSIHGTIDGTFTLQMSGVTIGDEQMSGWSNKRILAALKKSEFPLVDQIAVVNNVLTLTYDVTMYIDTIQNEVMSVIAVPLE